MAGAEAVATAVPVAMPTSFAAPGLQLFECLTVAPVAAAPLASEVAAARPLGTAVATRRAVPTATTPVDPLPVGGVVGADFSAAIAAGCTRQSPRLVRVRQPRSRG